jgi:hypothetical protein
MFLVRNAEASETFSRRSWRKDGVPEVERDPDATLQ